MLNYQKGVKMYRQKNLKNDTTLNVQKHFSRWRHKFIMACQKRKKSILSFLAHYSRLNIYTYVKTGIYIKDNSFTFQNIKTELKNLY